MKGVLMVAMVWGLFGLLMAGVVLYGVFWMLRGFMLWYWRVDEALHLLDRQARAAERTAGAVEELVERTRTGR